MSKWQTVQLRHLTQCLDGRRVPLNSEQRSKVPGDYPYWGANGIVDTVGDFLFDEPLILLGEDGAPFGDLLKDVAFLIDGRVWVNNHIHVLRPLGHVDHRFLTYALNTVDWPRFITGSTREKLTQDDMNRVRIVCPDRDTQQAIADYLDFETARIDSLIIKKLRMIDASKEWQVVSESASVLAAGSQATPIPTIPTVPAGWRVLRNKVFMREINAPSLDGTEEMLSVSHITGVTPRSEKTVNMFEAESTAGYKTVQPGDLVINTMWAWMGAAGVARVSGIVSPAYGVYRIDPTIMTPDYFDIVVRTSAYITEMTR